MKTKNYLIEDKSFNDDELLITHFISTTTPDRYGDIVHPEGMICDNYQKNPVVLFGHRSSALVIGKNLNLVQEINGVKAITKFADTEQGREIYKLNRDGFLNAWSIGFIPLEEEMRKDESTGKSYNHITKWELLEYSSVPIPANPDCLNLMLKDISDVHIKEIIEDENATQVLLNQLLIDMKVFHDKVSQIEDKTLSLENVISQLENKISHKIIDLIRFVKSL